MAANSLIQRAKSILLMPRSEWPVIAAEPDTVGGLYAKYIVIMAAIPAVVHFVSASLIGVSVPLLGYYRVGVGAALTTAVLAYVLALVVADLRRQARTRFTNPLLAATNAACAFSSGRPAADARKCAV